ncbi:branched-chain amino acid ABC transporter permease [Brevibacillus humidisoli]|uniref:branched-chain amino acid ABC transporter permease n=1 Tax=Brevibacillus humidisoli TaxID=2895522 RepID=UPI001E36BC5F|nr:branched-chain amino acid ABC transporter permease [Brevibacillus humidisoli]UFJ39434.1 branched-chain amino acid ABC transporter permease [Brevibacillus humidisoli]
MEKQLETNVHANKPVFPQRWHVLMALGLLLFAVPLSTGSYITSLFVLMGIYVIAATGMTLIMGYGGIVTLCQAAFWGMGAYTSGILTATYGFPPIVALLIGIVLTGGVAALLGLITINLHGHLLSLATLGFGIVVNIFLLEETELTGGPSGLVGIPSFDLFGLGLSSETGWFYFVWAVALALILLVRNLVSSAWGRTLQAVHASSAAAEAMGVHVGRYRWQAFIISAVLGSISGSLYAHYMTFISPELFGFEQSIKYVLMAVVGGLASVWGGLVGVIVVTVLIELLREVIPLLLSESSAGAMETIFFGGLLVVMMIFMPQGISGGLSKLWSKLRQHDGRKAT